MGINLRTSCRTRTEFIDSIFYFAVFILEV